MRVMKKFSTMCPHKLCPSCIGRKNILEPKLFLHLKKEMKETVPLIYGSLERWRYKAKLAVREEKGFKMGLFKKRTHDIVEIPKCISHHPSIYEIIKTIQKIPISPYCEETGKGILRYVQFFVSRETKKVQLSLVVNQEKENSFLKNWISHLKKKSLIHSIWLNFHTEKSNTIFSDHWKCMHGSPFIKQRLGGQNYAFHPASFSQAHLVLFEKVLYEIEKEIPPQAKVIDYYAGMGILGIHLSKKCEKVQLVEKNPYAFRSFQKTYNSLSKQQKQKLEYVQEDVSSLKQKEDIWDHVILDPPKKGVNLDLLHQIVTNKKIKKIIYLSCNVLSFIKDNEFLQKNGFVLTKIKAYLFFPGSDQIEVFAVFERKSG